MADLAEQIREQLDWQERIIKGADDGVLRSLEEADQWKAALLAALELHKPYEHHRIRCSHCTGHGVVNLDWPCPTVMTIAAALGIAIHDSRIEGDDAH